MRVAYLAIDVYGLGGTEHAVIAQANAMSAQADVEVVSVYRSRATPHSPISSSVRVTDLVHVLPDEPAALHRGLLGDQVAQGLRGRPSILVPPHWDPNFDALSDVALEHYLPQLKADVLVTFAPALMAVATQLASPRTAVVHQEHRSPSQRVSGLTPLLAYGPRADAIALLTEDSARWLTPRLGPAAPPVVVVPNALPPGYRPRSRLDQPVIVAAGRLVGDKQFEKLVESFAQIHERIPGWRLRIFGSGGARNSIRETAARFGLYDKVELPGPTTQMPSEWARGSVAALTSAKEGLPLVIQEAMAAGLPVASFDCNTGPRDLVQHEVNGLLVAPGSVPGMASSLLRLATDPELRRRLGDGAVASTAAFDSRAITQRWVEVFHGAMRARGRAGRTGRASLRQIQLAQIQLARREPPNEKSPEGLSSPTPGRDRGALLELVAGVAERAAEDWLVLPPVDLEPPVVVIPDAARDAFLARLAATTLPVAVALREPALNGWPERRGPVAAMSEDLRRGRSPVVHLEAPPLDAGAARGSSRVTVQFWDRGPEGDLHAPLPHPLATRLPAGLGTTTATVDGISVPVPTSSRSGAGTAQA
jgi:glycosyltransferase involved in cell wall biosynthesis